MRGEKKSVSFYPRWTRGNQEGLSLKWNGWTIREIPATGGRPEFVTGSLSAADVRPTLCLQRLRFTGLLWPKGGRFTLLVVFPNTSFQRILERIMCLRGLRDLPWLIPLPCDCLSSSSWLKTVEICNSFILFCCCLMLQHYSVHYTTTEDLKKCP